MRPKITLTQNNILNTKVPKELNGQRHAIAAWKRAMKTYSEKGIVANVLFYSSLIMYCKSCEEKKELEKIRAGLFKLWKKSDEELRENTENKNVKTLQRIANGFYRNLKGYDKRIEGKKKLILMFQKKLYLT